MIKKKTILICPLDWGLGHATRCVPLIQQFLTDGHEVIIGADKNPLAFLKQEFPALKTVVIPGYDVFYGEKGRTLKLFYESVKFFNFIKQEHAFIDNIVEAYNIDMIVSDNRYGLWSRQVKSIIITHQLYVKAPIGEKIAHQKIEKLISNFDECWIPDNEGSPNLSGDLAHLKPFKHRHKFIGPLSRFSKFQVDKVSFKYDIIAIISGPEPQRTVFEKLILEEIENSELKAVVVLGNPQNSAPIHHQSTLVFNHLSTEELYNYIQQSKVVVCRAGYSSLMDLMVLNKKAILIPTPGQTEQEYLARYHTDKGFFCVQNQKEFDLQKGLLNLNLI